MQVSFILSLFNQLALTQACWAGLRATLPPDLECEFLLADDGSTDGTRNWLEALKQDRRTRIVLNEQNLGYATSNNRAARLARGHHLFLLNSDLELLPNWFEPMFHALEATPSAGMIGNVQLRAADGTLDHRGILLDPLRRPFHDQRKTPPLEREPLSVYPAVTAACCAIRRDRFLDAGGFDEAFRNGFEDVDLCLRLTRDRGFHHYVANRSVVRHHVAASRGRGRTSIQRENLRLFLARWGWPPPGPPPRLLGRVYLRRHVARPWRYHGGKLLLALSRIATGRYCEKLRDRLGLIDDV